MIKTSVVLLFLVVMVCLAIVSIQYKAISVEKECQRINDQSPQAASLCSGFYAGPRCSFLFPNRMDKLAVCISQTGMLRNRVLKIW